MHLQIIHPSDRIVLLGNSSCLRLRCVFFGALRNGEFGAGRNGSIALAEGHCCVRTGAIRRSQRGVRSCITVLGTDFVRLCNRMERHFGALPASFALRWARIAFANLFSRQATSRGALRRYDFGVDQN